MSPFAFLVFSACLVAAAVAWHQFRRRRRTRQLASLARELGMHYSVSDRFGLASRIPAQLPVTGAADVRVFDVLYRLRSDHYRYICSAEYTTGIIRTKRRQTCVLSITEPKDRRRRGALHVQPAKPANGAGPVQQYRALAGDAQRPSDTSGPSE
jgi:hypothetical protein